MATTTAQQVDAVMDGASCHQDAGGGWTASCRNWSMTDLLRGVGKTRAAALASLRRKVRRELSRLIAQTDD